MASRAAVFYAIGNKRHDGLIARVQGQEQPQDSRITVSMRTSAWSPSLLRSVWLQVLQDQAEKCAIPYCGGEDAFNLLNHAGGPRIPV